MKKFGIIALLIAIIFQAYSQEVISREKQQKESRDTLLKSDDDVNVVIGKDLLRIDDNKDAFKIRLGDRGLNILESLESNSGIKFENNSGRNNWFCDEDKEERHLGHGRFFRGHWAGIEFGFNNWLTADNSMVMPQGIDYMTLNSSKSNNFNFNFIQKSMGITRHFGLVTGMGINWNNYRFDGNNNIQDSSGTIIALYPGAELEKSKLTTIYLTVPLMVELQIPTDNHRLNIAAGVIGAVKLCSHTKMLFRNNDKIKTDGDFNLNLLRYGPTARIGFENFHIYATYYMTPLFKTGKGPGGVDLYPFEIGIALTFND